MNDVKPELLEYALSEQESEVDLVFPPGETWLGSIVPEVVAEVEKKWHEMSAVRVRTRKLDDVLDGEVPEPVLLKIDVEGSEEAVLRGGMSFIAKHKPAIIFESNYEQSKESIYTLFEELSYVIHDLPFRPDHPGKKLTRSSFRTSDGTNFMAWPESRSS
jgi:FkbM family methyltransferase